MPDGISSVFRWIARSTAILVAGAYLFMVAGEFLYPHSGPPSQVREWLGIALLALSVAGMLLAWKWELPGAVLSLVALAIFVPVVHFHGSGIIGIVALPGILFLLSWAARHFRPPNRGAIH